MIRNLTVALFLTCITLSSVAQQPFTVIAYNQPHIAHKSQQDTQKLITKINRQTNENDPNYLSKLISIVSKELIEKNIPYRYIGAQGEGSLCNNHKPGCIHIQQDPIYRTDSFDCNTLVQYILALIHARNLDDFHKNLLEINYGANSQGHSINSAITFKNRNNFFSTDFLKVNHFYHRLSDITQTKPLKTYSKTISTTIDHARWFAFKAKTAQIKGNVRVLNKDSGILMANRLRHHYAANFPLQHVTLTYIPKQKLTDKKLLSNIQTPAVIEIVRDPNKYFIDQQGKAISIQTYYGTNFLVTHLAILYRHHYRYHQLVYQKINCADQATDHCQVTPVLCHNKVGCNKLMMLAATDRYPNTFIWSRKGNHFYCTAPFKQPLGAIPLSTCNRVVTMPFLDYLQQKNFNTPTIMKDASIVGIHIEKISAKAVRKTAN